MYKLGKKQFKEAPNKLLKEFSLSPLPSPSFRGRGDLFRASLTAKDAT
jgi:hypothetical protein